MKYTPSDDLPSGEPTAPGISNRPLDTVIERRRLIRGSLLGGVALWALAGCESPKKTSAMGDDLLQNPDPLPAERPAPAPVFSRPQQAPRPAPGPASYAGVLPRSRWTRSGVISSLANPMNGVRRITVHHTAIPAGDIRSEADAARQINGVRNSHVRRGWADIGYHFVVDPQGRVWEGRPLGWQGAHVEDNNEHNLGIVLLGNFDRASPSQAQLNSLDALVVEQGRRFGVPLNRVYTHRELRPTACPGRSLQQYMVATRSNGRMRAGLA